MQAICDSIADCPSEDMICWEGACIELGLDLLMPSEVRRSLKKKKRGSGWLDDVFDVLPLGALIAILGVIAALWLAYYLYRRHRSKRDQKEVE